MFRAIARRAITRCKRVLKWVLVRQKRRHTMCEGLGLLWHPIWPCQINSVLTSFLDSAAKTEIGLLLKRPSDTMFSHSFGSHHFSSRRSVPHSKQCVNFSCSVAGLDSGAVG